LLLTQGPSHGYELARRLRPMFPRDAVLADASVVYRLLRGLEVDGLVRSSWAENAGSGPARHVYELTDSGRDRLDAWASSIAGEIHALSGMLAVYSDATAERHGTAAGE
jgi:DNA-binding PadR family transcriptional regulator